MIPLGAWRGGRRFLLATGGAGVAGAVLALLAGLVDPRRTLFAWLFAEVYWTGLAVGALLLLCLLRAIGARWSVVLERLLATMAGALPGLALLFLPVLLGARLLYPWVDPRGTRQDVQRLVAHQAAYANLPFFAVRAVACFAVWIVAAELLLAWSRRQDDPAAGPPAALAARQRTLGALALPPVAWALSTAALDWVMSLEPDFSSTLFPVYLFAGAFLGALAALAIATATSGEPGFPGTLARAPHRAALGKLLLAFSAFWFYVAFDQYFLVWIADLPREVHWFLVRTAGAWGAVGAAAALGQAALPLLPLLSRPLKERRGPLAAVALWVLLAHAVDTYWLVLPAANPAAPSPRWADLFAFVGVGGLAAALVAFRLRGRPAVPVRHPQLAESLGYAGS